MQVPCSAQVSLACPSRDLNTSDLLLHARNVNNIVLAITSNASSIRPAFPEPFNPLHAQDW